MGEGLEFVFWCLAIGGTIVFSFKLVMLFVGLDGDFDADADVGDVDGGDTSAAFKLYTKMRSGDLVILQPEVFVQLMALVARTGFFR